MSVYEQMVGNKYGKLFVNNFWTEELRDKNGRRVHKCDVTCDCGKRFDTRASSVFNNLSASCGCSRKNNPKTSGIKNINYTGYQDITGQWWSSNYIRANEQNLSFTITKEQIWNLYLKQNRKCALSGVPIIFGNNKIEERTASIDRIDSSKGYEIDNVQIVHKRLNIMKNNMSNDELIDWCRKVSENTKNTFINFTSKPMSLRKETLENNNNDESCS